MFFFLFFFLCYVRFYIYICVFKYLISYLALSNVFHISEAATIALHSMGVLARSGESLSVQQISEQTGYSKSHTAKVLQQLARFNFLNSTRGPRGGFSLKKDPAQVSLLEIYRIIEGERDEKASNCRMECENCPFENCLFGGLNEKFNREFEAYLAKTTLMAL